MPAALVAPAVGRAHRSVPSSGCASWSGQVVNDGSACAMLSDELQVPDFGPSALVVRGALSEHRHMKSVIIGVDESDGATAALRWGIEYAQRHALPATALLAWTYRAQHQLDPEAPFDLGYGGEDAERDLVAIVERGLGSCPNGLRLLASCGAAADTLIEASNDAALVVVGARGIGGFKGLLIGSVSRQVLHRSHAPVAVVREAVAESDGPIVVGVDGSPASRRALAWALEEARSRRCGIVAVHAWHISYANPGYPSVDLGADALRQSAATLLDRELAQADTVDLVSPVVRSVVAGTAARVLMDASATASMVVLGSRGHRPLSSLLLGSVADQITHHAHSAVVVVPPSAPLDSPADSKRSTRNRS